ncbi:hypothetical protein Tco_1380551, partial [Tanacetum coccineum]
VSKASKGKEKVEEGKGKEKVEEGKGNKKWTKQAIKLSKSPFKKGTKRKTSDNLCKFRLWGSWIQNEASFQIKTLIPDHNCARVFDFGALVTYKWISRHYVREIVSNPKISHRELQDAIREKFLINVSLGQVRRAKQKALYDFESGLIEHYGKLWDYRDQLLKTNPGLAVKLDVDKVSGGKTYFKRLWDLTRIPCIHGVAAYAYLMKDPAEGVSDFYSKTAWQNCYISFIKHVSKQSVWVKTRLPPPMPLKEKRQKHPRCKNEIVDPPPKEVRPKGKRKGGQNGIESAASALKRMRMDATASGSGLSEEEDADPANANHANADHANADPANADHANADHANVQEPGEMEQPMHMEEPVQEADVQQPEEMEQLVHMEEPVQEADV